MQVEVADGGLAARTRPEARAQGYHDFANFIASDPELSIYRRFGSLAARNLLYLEAELQLLECQLEDLEREDEEFLAGNASLEDKAKLQDALWRWERFKEQAMAGPTCDARQVKRMEIVMNLRRLMEQYGLFTPYSPSPSYNKILTFLPQKKHYFAVARSSRWSSRQELPSLPSAAGFSMCAHFVAVAITCLTTPTISWLCTSRRSLTG
jgi:hypothetical protein